MEEVAGTTLTRHPWHNGTFVETKRGEPPMSHIRSPRLKSSAKVEAGARRKTIAHKAFRVGQGQDPIDESITVIVFLGSEERIESAVRWLKEHVGGPVPTYHHGDHVHEVMVRAPVASAQIALLADRCGVKVKSIDHVPEPVFTEFVMKVRKYLAWKKSRAQP